MFSGNSSRKRKAVTSLSNALKKAKVGVVTSKSKSLTAKVNKLIRSQELKFKEYLPGASALAVAGSQVVITGGITQGDDSASREGRRICCKYIHLHGFYQCVPGSTGSRLILVQDKQVNGTAATLPDIVSSSGSSLAESMINFNTRERFRILYDSYAGSNAASMTDATATLQTVFVDKYIPLQDLEVTFASAATAEATTNSLAMWLMGPVTCSQAIHWRLVWTDA